MKTVARIGRVRRSTIAYAILFCLAVVLYFVLRPEPSGIDRVRAGHPQPGTDKHDDARHHHDPGHASATDDAEHDRRCSDIDHAPADYHWIGANHEHNVPHIDVVDDAAVHHNHDGTGTVIRPASGVTPRVRGGRRGRSGAEARSALRQRSHPQRSHRQTYASSRRVVAGSDQDRKSRRIAPTNVCLVAPRRRGLGPGSRVPSNRRR